MHMVAHDWAAGERALCTSARPLKVVNPRHPHTSPPPLLSDLPGGPDGASQLRPVPSRVFQKLQTSTKVDPCAACRLEQHRRCAAAPEVPPPPPLPGGRAGPGCLLLHPSTQRPLPPCRQPAGQCHGGSAHGGAAAGGRGVSSDRQPCGVAARCLKTPRRTWPCSHSPAPHPPHPLIPDSTLDPPGSAPASTEQPPPPRRRRRHCGVATCAACCGSCAPTTAANTL